MKKVLLLLVATIVSGCYSYVEYDAIQPTTPGPWALDFNYPGLNKANNKVITVNFKDIGSLLHLEIRIYSEAKVDTIFITKAKIIGENYDKEFEYNTRVEMVEDVTITESPPFGDSFSTVLPIYKGFIGTPNLNKNELHRAADGNNMKVEVFYLDEVTNEEKSITFDIIKKHYKSWVPPT